MISTPRYEHWQTIISNSCKKLTGQGLMLLLGLLQWLLNISAVYSVRGFKKAGAEDITEGFRVGAAVGIVLSYPWLLILSQRSSHAGTLSTLEFLTHRHDPLSEAVLILLSAPQPGFPVLYLSLRMCVAAGRRVYSCKCVCLCDVCGRKGANLTVSMRVEMWKCWAGLSELHWPNFSSPHKDAGPFIRLMKMITPALRYLLFVSY